ITVNTDSSVSQTGLAAAGGILRNNEGRNLGAFTMNLGRCSVTRAELRGALQGLERAWVDGYRLVELQLDSTAAISLLLSEEDPSHQHATEVLKFRGLQRRNCTIRVRHVYREGNKAVDYLACRGHDFPFGAHVFPSLDSNLGHILRHDCLGISEPRFVLINT
ncbi:Putative ribonuclease H protein At1g65750, partial [Linum perenne]